MDKTTVKVVIVSCAVGCGLIVAVLMEGLPEGQAIVLVACVAAMGLLLVGKD